MSGASDAKEVNDVISIWNNYVNLETFQEDESNQREIDMQEEYKRWSIVKPKLVKAADGKYTVVGLPTKI
jgi:hypothetical protein